MAERVETEFVISLDKFQSDLDALIKRMDAYDKAAADAVKATDDLSGKSGSAAKKTRELGAAADSTASRLKDVGDSANELGQELGDAAKDAAGLGGAFGKVGQSALNLGKAVVAALGPIGLAITAVVGAAAALVKIFFDTERGGDALGKVISTVSTVFQRLLGLAQELAFSLVDTFSNPQQAVKDLWEAIKVNIANRLQGLVDQFKFLGEVISGVFTLDSARIEAGVKGFAESTVQAFTGVDNAVGKVTAGFNKLGQEIRGAANDGQRIFDIGEELEDLAIRRAKEEAKLNRIVSEQLTIARDANATTAQRKAAAEEAIKAQDKLADLAKEQASLELERLLLQQKQNDTGAEGLLERANLEAQLDQIEADRLDAQRRARAIISGIDKANADAAVANAKRVAEESARAEQQSAEERELAARQLAQAEEAAFSKLEEIQRDRAVSQMGEEERRIFLIREAAQKEIDITRKLFEDLEAIADEEDLEAIRQAKAEAIIALEQNLADKLLKIDKETKEKLAEQSAEDKEKELQALLDDFERRKAIIEEGAQVLSGIVATAVESPEEAAKQAAKVLLDLAFKQLEAQSAIWSAQIVGGSLATPDSIATGGATGVARFTAILAILRGALAVARGAITGAFYDGGIVGRDGGTKMHSGRDGYLVRAHQGEYIMPTSETRKYMPYLEAMRDGTFEHLVAISKSSSATPIPSFSDRGIVGAIGGSIAEERRQTELLATIAKGMRRGVNKRYYA